MRRTRTGMVAAVTVLVSLAQPSAQSPNSWRPTVVAQHGMVAAGHPLAAEAGLRILKAGGNAVDAAIATWAVQGEVEPGMTGLGADMFVLVYLAKTGEVKFINGTGFAPQAATIDFYKSKGGIPESGPLSISVPGAVGGAAMALKKYGTRPLADVLAPAIEIADQGFPITESLARGLAGSREKLATWPSTTKIWFRNGKPLETGDIVTNPELARTLRAIAAQGPDAFYRGDVAKTTAAYLKTNGGIITEADLRSYEPYEDAPIHVNYRGTEVYECPPNSQGFVMLEALNILEGFDLKAMGHNSAPYLHAVTESLKLSFADRNAYVGDPKFVPNIPMAQLLSKEYAAARRSQINPALAVTDGKPYIVFGTPGADTQPQTQLQFFLNVVEFGMPVQQALEQPTVISNSFRDSYYPHAVVGKLLTPAMLPQNVRDGLAAKGHQLDLRDVKGVGSVKGIMIHPRTGALMGGVSPTGDSYVMGW